MRQVVRLLHPKIVYDIRIVAASAKSWMAEAVMADGNDRRFRFQENRLLDEATIGDERVA
jgi:hypothetical protein